MKNVIYGVVIVLCLLVAGIVIFRGGSKGSGVDDIPDADQIWVACTNKACGATYEMGKKQYFKELKAKAEDNPSAMVVLVTCKECGQDKVTEAIKCEKCDNVFIKRAGGEFPDKCPKCGYSKVETRWKERTGR